LSICILERVWWLGEARVGWQTHSLEENIATWQGEKSSHAQNLKAKGLSFIFLGFHWRMDWPDFFFRWERRGEEEGEAPKRPGQRGRE